MADVLIKIVAEDEATGPIEQIIGEHQKLGTTVETTEKKSRTATQGFTQAIKEQRQEHRLLAFAVNNTAGTVGELSNVFVGPNGITKALTGAAGQAFEMNATLKLLGETAGTSGGLIGKAGAAISAFAGPIAIAIGAFALIKGAIDDANKSSTELQKKIHDLKVELGIIPSDKIAQLQKTLDEAIKDATEHAKPYATGFWNFFIFAAGGIQTVLNKIGIDTGKNIANSYIQGFGDTVEERKLELQKAFQEAALASRKIANTIADDESKANRARIQRDIKDEKEKENALFEEAKKRLLDTQEAEKKTNAALAGDDKEKLSRRQLYTKQTAEYETLLYEHQKSLKDLEVADVKKLQEIYKESGETRLEISKREESAIETDAKKKVDIETGFAIKKLTTDKEFTLKSVDNAKERAAIEQKYGLLIQLEYLKGEDAKRKIAEETTKKLDEEAKKRLRQEIKSTEEINKSIIDLDTQRLSDAAQNEEQLVQIKAAAEDQKLTEEQNAAILEADLAGATAEELNTIYEEFEKKREVLAKKTDLDIAKAHKKVVLDDTNFMLQSITKAFSVLSMAAQESTSHRIDDINTEKDAYDKSIDAQIKAAEDLGQNTDALRAQKEAADIGYEKRIADEKTKAWNAEHNATLLSAIANGVEAVTKAWAQLGIFGAVGAAITTAATAAEIAIIAGQTPPKFALGTPEGGFMVPPGFERDNFMVGVSSGERVDVSPRDQISSSGNTFNGGIHISISGVNDDKKVAAAIVKRLRDLGTNDFNKAFRNDRSVIRI